MKKLILLPIAIFLLSITSCTTDEITNEYFITEEVTEVIEGAYYNEVRLESQNTMIQEGVSTEIGILVFDCQGIKMSRLDLEINLDNDEDASGYIESITLTKINDENNLYVDELDIDDEEYYIEWKPITENTNITSLDSYKLVITPTADFIESTTADFELDLRLRDLFGDYEYVNINGNINSLHFVKN
jgi:hypothetical protein